MVTFDPYTIRTEATMMIKTIKNPLEKILSHFIPFLKWLIIICLIKNIIKHIVSWFCRIYSVKIKKLQGQKYVPEMK